MFEIGKKKCPQILKNNKQFKKKIKIRNKIDLTSELF